MEIKENNSPSSYGKPPWIFRGSALYQLHLVKAETARPFIPKEFKLVEAFGYTLGGFFLANYEDSPAGTFDELVVIAGIVWNPPTSCAWAARVLVDSKEACNHGRKEVGLPSQVARFSKHKYTAISRTPRNKLSGFLDMIGMNTFTISEKNSIDLHVSEIKGQKTMGICNISLGTAAPEQTYNKWKGPLIKMSLPSFSGRTEYNPCLLKYTCQIECRVRAVSPAKVSGPCTSFADEEKSSEHQDSSIDFTPGGPIEHERNLSISVMLSKPILALQFNCLKMKVEAPIVISEHKQNTIRSY